MLPPGTSQTALPAVDTGTRAQTRVLLLFSLSGRVPARPSGAESGRLVEQYDFGRFAPHMVRSEAVLPTVVLAEQITPGDLALPPGTPASALASAGLLVITTPREDATLVLDCVFAGETDAENLAVWLAATCFRREQLTYREEPLLDRLSTRLAPREPLGFGLNVHQIVCPGGALLSDVLSAGALSEQHLSALVSTIVYRGQLQLGEAAGQAARRLGVSVPPQMTDPGSTLVAHGRGVSVLAGWSGHVENALSLVAMVMLSALAVLQRARLTAFTMLGANQRATLNSAAEARELISTLSAGVNELQLDLAFGVEAYVDSLLVPEMLIEAFQRSLHGALSVRDGLDNCSRMVDRLTSVISARAAALESAVAERNENRERTVSILLAIATLISLPPALLLAFFGVNGSNVDDHRSIFDLSRYGYAYALAWLPFIVLVLAGFLLRKRFNRAWDAGPPAAGPVHLPPPRSPQAR